MLTKTGRFSRLVPQIRTPKAMGDEPKRRSARRTLFPPSDNDDAPAPSPPSIPTPALMTLPQSQSASNLLSFPPQRINKSPAKEMDEGKPAPQPHAGDPSPAIANSFSPPAKEMDDGVQKQQQQEKEEVNEGVQEEKEKADDGVQEEKEKAAPPASAPVSTPPDVPAGDKKKAMAKGKGAAHRVWSLQDEVRILERLVAFVKTHGVPPARSQLQGVVHGHVLDKKEFTKTEIYEKVRRLRDRYYTLRTKAAAAAGAPPSGNAEDLRKYELSREIWGDSLLPLPKREVKEKVFCHQPRVRRQFEELQNVYPDLTILVEEIAAGGHGALKRAYGLIDDGKARALDAKVRKQRILEFKMELDRSSAQREVLRTLIE